MKYNGFNLEDTHMRMTERLEKLMAVCTFAVALCIRAGISKHAIKPIPYKKTVKSYLYSFFQYGLNHIRTFYDDILEWVTGIKLKTKNCLISINYAYTTKNEG